MSKLNHARASFRLAKSARASGAEQRFDAAGDVNDIIKGMGRGKRPPLKRIAPQSPEGRRIAEQALAALAKH